MRPLVVIGARTTGTTRSSTTAAAMCAWFLDAAGLEPGFALASPSRNLGVAARAVSTKRKIVGGSAKPPPFVVDAAAAGADGEDGVGLADRLESRDAVLFIAGTPDLEHVGELVARVPETGLVVCDAAEGSAVEIVAAHARARTTFFGIDRDGGFGAGAIVTPTWLGALAPADATSGAWPFDLYAGGSYFGRFAVPCSVSSSGSGGPGAGADDLVRIAVGAIAACAEGLGVDVEGLRRALTTFAAP